MTDGRTTEHIWAAENGDSRNQSLSWAWIRGWIRQDPTSIRELRSISIHINTHLNPRIEILRELSIKVGTSPWSRDTYVYFDPERPGLTGLFTVWVVDEEIVLVISVRHFVGMWVSVTHRPPGHVGSFLQLYIHAHMVGSCNTANTTYPPLYRTFSQVPTSRNGKFSVRIQRTIVTTYFFPTPWEYVITWLDYIMCTILLNMMEQ